MCCIFTCFGWFFDLLNRVITFTMSCTIVGAACLALVIAGMAGVALGYNYSLVEYMDLRETSVQIHNNDMTRVYPSSPKKRGYKAKAETRVDVNMRRGMFDDEHHFDLEDTRRTGALPPPRVKEDGVVRNIPEEADWNAAPPQGRRRLEDMVGEEPVQYESNLSRLTARPIASDPSPTVVSDTERIKVSHDPIEEDMNDRTSIDRLKAIQSLINSKRERNSARRMGENKFQNIYDTTSELLDPRLFPPVYMKDMPESARKAISRGEDIPLSPLRKAVPDQIYIDQWRKAAAAKLDRDPKLKGGRADPLSLLHSADYDLAKATFPSPMRTPGIERPTRPPPPPARSQTPAIQPRPPPRTTGTTKYTPEKFTENHRLAKFESRKKIMGEQPPKVADYYEDME